MRVSSPLPQDEPNHCLAGKEILTGLCADVVEAADYGTAGNRKSMPQLQCSVSRLGEFGQSAGRIQSVRGNEVPGRDGQNMPISIKVELVEYLRSRQASGC